MRIDFDDPTIAGVSWDTVWNDKLEPETALGLLTNGAAALISGPPLLKGVSDGKLAAGVTAESDTVGALFGNDTCEFSGANVAEGAGGKVDGRFDEGVEVNVILGELEPTGRKAGGNSAKFEVPVDKEGLKLGNCIGCCIDEGIDKPGGGRSKDC